MKKDSFEKPLPSPAILDEDYIPKETENEEDFICISEFSEHKGPIVVSVIPLENVGKFDIEAHVLRIMAVDYQNQTTQGSAFASDSQSVEPAEDFYSYIHHITLLDIRARGYARPICLSYISKDYSKIMNNFDALYSEFSKVSAILKVGNQKLFLKDLELKLQQVQAIVISENEGKTPQIIAGDIEHPLQAPISCRRTQSSTQHNSSNLNSPEAINSNNNSNNNNEYHSNEETFSTYDEYNNDDIKGSELQQDQPPTTIKSKPKILSSSSSSTSSVSISSDEDRYEDISFDLRKSSTNIETDSHDGDDEMNEEDEEMFASKVTFRRGSKVRRYRSDSISQSPHFSDDSSHPLEFISPDSLPAFSREEVLIQRTNSNAGGTKLDSLVKIKKACAKAKNNINSSLLQPLSNNIAICELITVLCDSNNIKSELHESINRDRNFNEGLRTIEQICGREYIDAMKRINSIFSHFSRPMTVLSLERDDISIAAPTSSLLTTGRTPLINFQWDLENRDNYFEQFLCGGSENTLPPHFIDSSSSSSSSSSPSSSYESIPSNDEDYERKTSISTQSTPLLPNLNKLNSSTDEKPSLLSEVVSDVDILESKVETTRFEKRKDSLGKDEDELNDKVVDYSQYFGFYDPLDPLRYPCTFLDSNTEIPTTRSFTSSGYVKKIESFAETLWATGFYNAGKGILELRTKYSFFPHLVYSLLKGRTVVVTSAPHRQLAAKVVVSALSIFVAGSWRHPLVVPWREEPLKITDLANIKLIGLSNHVPLSKSVATYVTHFDIEKETMVGPAYTGEFIDTLLGLKKGWPDDETLIAHIHYHLLSISIKSCLYYQMCCISFTKAEKKTDKLTPTSIKIISNDAFLNSRYQRINNNNNNNNNSINSSGNNGNCNISSNSNSSLGSSNSQGVNRKKINELPVVGIPSKYRDESKLIFQKIISASSSTFTSCDMSIIEYFAEVIKEQQSIEMAAIDINTPIVKLDYGICSTFNNTFPKKH